MWDRASDFSVEQPPDGADVKAIVPLREVALIDRIAVEIK